MTTPEDDSATPGSAGAVTPAAEMERRAFVRRMTTETVGIAGKVFGLSKALSRGAVAAGQAARENFEAVATDGAVEPLGEGTPVTAPEPADEPAAEGAAQPIAAPVTAPPPITPASPAAPSPVPSPSPSPPVRLSADQAALLARSTSAVLAVNGGGSPPLTVPLAVHWDGERVRFASLGWSRRSSAIRMDPHVSLVFQAEDSDAFVVVEGVAEFVTGPAAREAMVPLLSPTGDPAEAETRWTDLTAVDADRVVVFVRPTKVLPGRRA